MLDYLIFVILPYTALALLIFVTPYRFFSNRLTWSAYSTQFLERKSLFWGINPWHYGIIPVLFAHLIAVIFPGPLKALMGNQSYLILGESIGLALGIFAAFGCITLLLRRINSPMLKQVTFCIDWVLLLLLTAQTLSGIYISLFMRWGSQWYLHAAAPYFRSLAIFTPQFEYMTDFPLILKLHAAGAFIIIGLLPFTKLVHLLYFPQDFLKDPPILYRWRSREGG
jgi:nitrate reductase gamma subunit